MPRWESFEQFLAEAEGQTDLNARQQLVDTLLRERPEWPWIVGNQATFIFSQFGGARQVALNLDIIEGDPPFAAMTPLEGTSLWYVTREFERDDLLDYLIAVDDPMTPLRNEPNIVERIARHWRVDPRNPVRIATAQMETSILRMPQARPFPNWMAMPNVPRGEINEHAYNSDIMQFNDRKVWVYTPPNYHNEPDRQYPLLILLDGQWMVGPLQVPYIANALIKHRRMEPVIIAMVQSSGQASRMRDFVSNDAHYESLLNELVPLLQIEYRINGSNLGVGGVGVGAVAAAHATLKNPEIFNHLIMLSPPLGRGQMQQQLLEYADRFDHAEQLPRYIFQSVGRYEIKTRFYKPAIALAAILNRRQQTRGDVNYQFAELGSGHGLVAFKSVFPEALHHAYPAR